MLLFKKKSPEDPYVLISSHKEKDRVRAVKMLVANPEEKAYDILKGCLKDPDDEVKFIAFDFLYEKNPAIINEIDNLKAIKEAILFILKKEKYPYAVRAPRLCGSLKIAEAYPFFKKEFEAIVILTTDYEHHLEYLKAAIEIGDKNLTNELVKILESLPKPKVLDIIIDAFENKVKSETAITLLSKNIDLKTTTLKDKLNVMTDSFTFRGDTISGLKRQAYSALAIGAIGGDLAYSILIKGIDSNCSIFSRRACAIGLAKIKDPRSADALIDCLSDSDRTLRELATIALKSIGETITDKLLLKYDASNETLTDMLIFILDGFKNDQAQTFIEKFKKDPKYSNVFEALSHLQDEKEINVDKVIS